MFESLRMNVGIRLARMKFRKMENPVISFAGAISGSQRALVIMPLDKRDVFSAVSFIQMLKQKMKEENITVITDEHALDSIRLMPKSHFVQIKETDLNTFYHPRPEFLARVNDRKFDLVIDLNLDLVLPSAYICRESNAKIRVGFTGPNSDTFYNFQLRPDASLARKNIYDRIAQCLHMF